MEIHKNSALHNAVQTAGVWPEAVCQKRQGYPAPLAGLAIRDVGLWSLHLKALYAQYALSVAF